MKKVQKQLCPFAWRIYQFNKVHGMTDEDLDKAIYAILTPSATPLKHRVAPPTKASPPE